MFLNYDVWVLEFLVALNCEERLAATGTSDMLTGARNKLISVFKLDIRGISIEIVNRDNSVHSQYVEDKILRLKRKMVIKNR